MIYDCHDCGRQYSPGHTNACPQCHEPFDLRRKAEVEIAKLEPTIRRQHGKGARMVDIASTREGREYIGWRFVERGTEGWELLVMLRPGADLDCFEGWGKHMMIEMRDWLFCAELCYDRDRRLLSPFSDPSVKIVVQECVYRHCFVPANSPRIGDAKVKCLE